MNKNNCCKKTSIGGQALIEGIMMRGPHRTVMAVRGTDGNIVTEDLHLTQIKDKYKILGWPVIRGAVSMIESMVFGYKALMKSADMSGMLDEEEAEKQTKAQKKAKKASAVEQDLQKQPTQTAADESTDTTEADTAVTAGNAYEQPTATEVAKPEKKEDTGVLMTIIGAISMVLGVALSVCLFMWLPTFIFDNINTLSSNKIGDLRGVIEGVLKIAIFIAYITIVAQMKEIKRVFKYHGAEHKTIFCYEHGKELTVENVREERRFHPRCGTSFLILMLIVSIIFYTIIDRIFPALAVNKLVWVGLKLVCLPFIVGIGYELIKFCGRHDNLLTRIIAAPGMWVQRITTSEPEDSMIEVAICAMKEVIPENNEDDQW